MKNSSMSTGLDALHNADTHVIKIGGDNAGNIASNAENVRRKQGGVCTQILALSAIRSSDTRFNAYADPVVIDTDADQRQKSGFNTTSHLIAIAELLQSKDEGDRAKAMNIARRIGAFTRDIVMQEIQNDSSIADPDALQCSMDALISQYIDGAHDESSLLYVVAHAEEKCHVLQRDQDWIFRNEDEYVSLTGIGEELAREIYALYFQHAGITTGTFHIEDSAQQVYNEMLSQEHSKANAIVELKDITRTQLESLLLKHSVILAGGYLPVLGSQRGYSDYTGAFLAEAAHGSGKNTAFVIEKAYPIMSADPVQHHDAKVIQEMTYFLAMELFGNRRGANGGAVHPNALSILAESDIDTVVMNPEQPVTDSNTTLIHDFDPPINGVEIIASKSIPFALQITSSEMIGQPGFEAAIADWFLEKGISIQHIATSEGTLSYTFYHGEYSVELVDSLRQFLREEFDVHADKAVETLQAISVVYCLGNNMQRPGQAAKATDALEIADVNIHMITQGLNESVMTFVIDEADAEKAVSSLHDVLITMPNDIYEELRQEFHKKLKMVARETVE